MHQKKELSDTLLLAYLIEFENITIRPKTTPNKKISFEAIGPHLDEAIQRFYENPKLPILNFCSSYKRIRSMIFNLREERIEQR